MDRQPIDPHEVGVVFLKTEIETGLTFAGLAADAGDDTEKRKRNRENANTAVVTVERFLPTVVGLTPDDVTEIKDGLERLRRAIAAIPA